MSLFTAWAVAKVPQQVTQKANRDQTVLVNAGTVDVYLNDQPMAKTTGLLLQPGYGITVNAGVEVWAYTLVDGFSTLTVAEGVGPIFSART